MYFKLNLCSRPVLITVIGQCMGAEDTEQAEYAVPCVFSLLAAILYMTRTYSASAPIFRYTCQALRGAKDLKLCEN